MATTLVWRGSTFAIQLGDHPGLRLLPWRRLKKQRYEASKESCFPAFHGKCMNSCARTIPEVWRWRRKGLAAYSLGADGKYHERELSLNLPALRVKDLQPFLDFELAADELTWIRRFRGWVRERFAPS